jgi:hypothetical protein
MTILARYNTIHNKNTVGVGTVESHHLACMFLLECLYYLRNHSADAKGQGHVRIHQKYPKG